MDGENQEVIYCPEDDEYRIYSDICDRLCIERFYKNHLKSQTHTNNIHKRQIILNKWWSISVKCVIDQLSKIHLNIKKCLATLRKKKW